MILFGECLEQIRKFEPSSVDSLVTDPPAGISFMNKHWDNDKGGRDEWIKWLTEVMLECERVLKPGAHCLVWAIPRTSHWTATAIENAGFEIRDVVTHLFGSGFPKSLDISKAIDKANGITEWKETTKNPAFRANQLKHNAKWDTRPRPPKPVVETEQAKQYQGWGTALKPASEHWILARKPLSEKTVAKNVLKWGVGGLNIDASRISVDPLDPNHRKDTGGYASKESKANTSNAPYNSTRGATLTTGRFPANLVFSHTEHCTDIMCDIECAIKALDEQSGVLKSGQLLPGHKQSGHGDKYSYRADDIIQKPYGGDQGGASRFFYCAKVSTSERNHAGDNKHPTVKPIKLMQYLIKLITPPGGVVLDPFMGSGSTGVACKKAGFKFIGIEREKEYFEIAKKRISVSK